ncbi:MAG: hypothetical protein NW208_04970 [Bryobacter sp.]|nr:hypothetical protein [Bryobacter sp.]
MSFSLILAAISVVLFAYWFRYSCILILRTRTAEDYALDVCRANGMTFAQIRIAIDSQGSMDLDKAYTSLTQDFALVSQLLEQKASEETGFEHKLLGANFQVTKLWFQVSRMVGLGTARTALTEMADTVAYFANSFGEASATSNA